MLIKSANTAQAGTPNQSPVMGQMGIIANSRMKIPIPTRGLGQDLQSYFYFSLEFLILQPDATLH
jgi:hypothetical protein